MWVKGIKADCTGVGPMKCLQVQKNEIIEPGKWQNFYSEIEGFHFQSGNLSKLLVTEKKLDKSQVPADGSSIKYTLVEVLEKKPDPVFELHDIWTLEAINGKMIQKPGGNASLINPSIEINLTEMKVMGNDGCNQFFGPIINAEEDNIEFGDMAVTMKMCMNMEIPDRFNEAMAKVKKYRRDGLKLFLLDESETELLRFKKVD
jgi:heat shock protein HslJ